MTSAVEEHVIYQIANASMREYPYPHIFVENIFPADFYKALRENWPDASDLVSLESTGRVPKGAYPERFIMALKKSELEKLPESRRAFWNDFAAWLLEARFLHVMVDKFEAHVRERFGPRLANVSFTPEVLVVRDHSNYKIGPHTDAPHRLMSLLFYCPDDDRLQHLGTSIYKPNDPAFRCEGGPHYRHDLFTRVATMAYRPNTLFAFFKTDHSFHGVEPIRDAEVLRDLMLYDIRVKERAGAKAEPDERASSLGATMLKRILRMDKAQR